MSKIEILRKFLLTCPFLPELSNGIHIDYTAGVDENYGIFPTGVSIIKREKNIIGEITLTSQYNAVIYARKITIDDVARLENCNFFENFTEWLHEQDFAGLVPAFGSPEFVRFEQISAENAILFDTYDNGNSGLYQIQISKIYKERYKNVNIS